MHRTLAVSALLVGTLVVSDCRDDATNPHLLRYGTVAIAPSFPAGASPAQVDHIHILLARVDTAGGPFAVDTTVDIPVTQDSAVVTIRVPLAAETQQFLLTLILTDETGAVLFFGGPVLITVSTSGVAGPPVSVQLRNIGADIVVFNDMNIFDPTAIKDPNNQQLVRNLVGFSSSGPRNNGDEVWFDFGRASTCAGDGECSVTNDSTMIRIIGQAGLQVTAIASTTDSLVSIPSSVKALFLWNPTQLFTGPEVAALLQFASEGGRIVFIGEHEQFYGAQGIATENQLLLDMGAQMTNTGGLVDCVDSLGNYAVLPLASLRPHQVTLGLADLTLACASVINPGPLDFPLVYDLTGTQLLAGVATVIAPPPVPVGPALRSDAERRAAFAREVGRLTAELVARRGASPGSARSSGTRP